MSIKQRIRKAVRTKPRKFQYKGIRWLQRKNGRGLLADDPGLGKTFQSLCWLKINKAWPAVIACPASLKYNWQRELRIHAGLRSQVIDGRRPVPFKEDILIINYDILKDHLERLLKHGIRTLIVDECQRCANRTTRRTRATKSLSRKVKHFIPLSGTPIRSCPVQFFPILNMLDRKRFKNFWDYAFEFCDPKPGFRGRGWDLRGASNLKRLHKLIKPYMLRRTMHEVLKELPRTIPIVIPVDIDNRKEYEQAQTDFIKYLRARKGRRAVKKAEKSLFLVRYNELKRIASRGKQKAIHNWLDEWFEGDKKIVVFTTNTDILKTLVQRYPKSVYINGSVTAKKRELAVRRFQKDKRVRACFGNLDSMGEGVTLTAASDVAFAQLGATPAQHDQAERRVLRIGQTAKSSRAYYFIAKDTIEERIIDVIEGSRSVVRTVLTGRNHKRSNVMLQVLNGLLRSNKHRARK